MKRQFDIKSYLPSIFLFSSLNDSELSEIAKTCSVIRPKKNTQIFSQEDAADAFYVVILGKISIFRLTKTGEEQVIHIHSDGDVVAEAAIFDKVKYPASCKTIKESMLLKIPREGIVDLIINNPETALKIMAAYSRRLREFVGKVEYLSIVDVKQRLARFFDTHKKNLDGKIIIELGITKKELAQLIGTIPETLSRNLKKLKDDQIISEANGVFEVLSIKKLKSLIGDQ